MAPVSALIDDELKEQLREILEKLVRDVVVVSVEDEANPNCMEMRDFLDVIATLSPHVRVQHVPVGTNPELEAETDARLLPVAALYSPEGAPVGVRFHGVPGGQELNTFVLALYNYAGPGQELDAEHRTSIDAITRKTDIRICVSLACHHCPATVTACQRIAIMNPNVSAAMVDARLYPELVEKYKLERVPCVVLNDEDVHVGSKNIDKLCELLR